MPTRSATTFDEIRLTTESTRRYVVYVGSGRRLRIERRSDSLDTARKAYRDLSRFDRRVLVDFDAEEIVLDTERALQQARDDYADTNPILRRRHAEAHRLILRAWGDQVAAGRHDTAVALEQALKVSNDEGRQRFGRDAWHAAVEAEQERRRTAV